MWEPDQHELIQGENSSEQVKQWAEFYEQAWELRRQKIQEFIKAGEKDPGRILERLYRFEGTHKVTQRKLTNDTHYKKEELDTSGSRYPTGKPVLRPLAVQEQVTMVPYYLEPMDFLADYLDDHSFEAVIELGSGPGTNIFKLYSKGAPLDCHYYAGEYTESGHKTCETLAQLKPEMKITPFRFDYKNPDLEVVTESENILIFSCHSVEQVKRLPVDLFSKLAQTAKKVVGIHFEPFGHQYKNADEKEAGAVSQYHSRACHHRGWNLNFIETLVAAEQRQEIKIDFLGKNVMGGMDTSNPTSIAMWHSPA